MENEISREELLGSWVHSHEEDTADTVVYRRADFDFVTSPEAQDIIQREGIVLLDYRALQKRWVG